MHNTMFFSGQLLQEARERVGLTQTQVAAHLVLRGIRKTISKQSVSQWEDDKYIPGANVVPALASILGVEEKEFFKSKGS